MSVKNIVRACALVVLIGATSMGVVSANGSTGGVSITVSVEAVAIEVTKGDVDFGGPYPPGEQVDVTGVPSPSIKNVGNVPIAAMDLEFLGPITQEADCGNGTSWAASASAPGEDQFVLRALAYREGSSQPSLDTHSKVVPPGAPSDDILVPAELNPDQIARMPMRLELPTAVTAGGNGCTIELLLTAHAADN